MICKTTATTTIGVEPDPVQSERLHPPSVRYELHRDAAGSDSCQLPDPPDLFLRPPLLGGGAASGVQALLAHHQAGGAGTTSAACGHLESKVQIARTPWLENATGGVWGSA